MKIIHFLLIIFLAVTLGVSAFFVNQKFGVFRFGTSAAGSGVILSLSPTTASLQSQQETTISVMFNSQNNTITATDLQVGFDRSKIAIVDISAGTLFPDPVVLAPFKVINGSGNPTLAKATFTIANKPTSTLKGIKGVGDVAKIKVKALGYPINTQATVNLANSAVAVLEQTSNTLEPNPAPATINVALVSSTAGSPYGWLDVADCSQLAGWAGDTNNINSPITINYYADGLVGTGTSLGSSVANITREAAVCQALGGTNCSVCPSSQPQCQHAFTFTTPTSLKDGKTHQIYAYGVNLSGTAGTDNLLWASPKVITCP